MLLEQRRYAAHDTGARRSTLSSIMLTRGKNDGEEEIWVGTILLQSPCVLEREKKEVEEHMYTSGMCGVSTCCK